MRFVHTADNHLDMPLSSLPPGKNAQRKTERRASFSKIIDFTIEKDADMLIISGDLFHTPNPSPSTLAFCFNEFERLGDIPVFIALGNHDYGISKFNFPGNVRIFSQIPESIIYKDYVITGCSFASSTAHFAPLIPPAADTAKLNILCIHGDITKTGDYNPIDKDTLSGYGYDYIALGHVHHHSTYKRLVYPGCHDGSGFDEPGEKGFVFCELDKNGARIDLIPSSSRLYTSLSFDISDCSSSLEVAQALEGTLSDDIYKITLVGNPKVSFLPNIDFIESYISQKVFFAKIEDETSADKDMSSSRLYKIFSEYLTENYDEEIALLAHRYGLCALKGDVSDI